MGERKIHHGAAAFRWEGDVPGDKSLSHRALIFASMAAGESRVSGLGPGADVASTRACLSRLGVTFTMNAVRSPGVESWKPASGHLDAGNSGTTLRLLAGSLAGRPFASVLDGDASLRRRPMRRLAAPLGALGALVQTSPEGTPPVTVSAPDGLHGADVAVDLPSAQVRSAFALAALQADGPSRIEGPPGFRDHTERWLEALGRARRESATALLIDPGPLPAGRYDVPGDPSSAAFLWTAAALLPGAAVTTRRVSLNPGRIGILEVLASYGAEVDAVAVDSVHGDPVGDVTVVGAGRSGVTVRGELTARTLDELPLVAILGMAGVGETVVGDAAELRVKESDRVASTVAMVRALGGAAEPTEDGFVVVGEGSIGGGRADAAGDHRIAMAAATAATVSREQVIVTGAEAAGVSWPGFYEVLEVAWSSR